MGANNVITNNYSLVNNPVLKEMRVDSGGFHSHSALFMMRFLEWEIKKAVT